MPANPTADIIYSSHLQSQTTFSLWTSSLSQKSNLRSKTSLSLAPLLCCTGVRHSPRLSMRWLPALILDLKEPCARRDCWHMTVWSQWQETIQSSLQVDRSTHCTANKNCRLTSNSSHAWVLRGALQSTDTDVKFLLEDCSRTIGTSGEVKL